ncbi:MAG: WD40/YVTN/BNR-like repeat-containing protein [Myxococcota bacterium]
MTRFFFFVLALLGAGCTGTVGELDGGSTGTDAGGLDAGPPPLRYTQFTQRADGWPAGARLVGAAVLDNVLFAATTQGLVQLPATDTRWQPVTTPLAGDVVPTSLQRVDQSLVMTAAGSSGGGLYLKPFDGEWSQVTTAPSAPAWALVKKSSSYLLATTGGLFAATSLDGTWARRSAMNTPLFTARTTRLVAAAAQQKLFASGDPGAGFGGLFESSDLGQTWAASAPMGQVEALAATGAFVLVSTATDGQLRSDNYGNTFRAAAMPISGGVLTFSVQGGRFWAGGNGGVLRSDDDGATFVDASSGLAPGTAVRALFFAGSYLLVDTPDGPWLTQVE